MTTKTPSFIDTIPKGDDKLRSVCAECGFIDYQNPKIVAGAVVVFEGQFLMCKRAIEPRSGYWTLPAGFMENHETVEEAARREAREEACADIVIDGLLGMFSIPRISQVQIMFAAHLETPDFDVGPESQEVRLYDWDDIPWEDLAFPTVSWSLRQYRRIQDKIAAGDAFAPLIRNAVEPPPQASD